MYSGVEDRPTIQQEDSIDLVTNVTSIDDIAGAHLDGDGPHAAHHTKGSEAWQFDPNDDELSLLSQPPPLVPSMTSAPFPAACASG